jgi:shikimate kinase
MDACRVILVGMMGSGKSTIGRLLSDATGWPYVDNDDLVLRSHGATSRQLLAERGEAAMRAAESSALALGLEEPEPVIVGAAAGTILDARDRDRMRDGGIVVWLKAASSVLAERAAGSEHRPWLDGDAQSWMSEAVAERDPLYASAADITLDTTSDPPDESVRELRRRLESTGRCP